MRETVSRSKSSNSSDSRRLSACVSTKARQAWRRSEQEDSIVSRLREDRDGYCGMRALLLSLSSSFAAELSFFPVF
jgi:hypothetical protein